MKQYIIVTATDEEALAESVSLRIDQGYIPQGGVLFANHPSGGPLWAQAMVRRFPGVF